MASLDEVTLARLNRTCLSIMDLSSTGPAPADRNVLAVLDIGVNSAPTPVMVCEILLGGVSEADCR